MQPERKKYYDKYRLKKRFMRKFFLIVLVSIAVCAIAFFAPFFKIKYVDITAGEKTYDAAFSYGETLKGKNINWYSTKNVEKEMQKWTAVKDVQVKRSIFNKITININERLPAFAIYIDKYYIIDVSGRILEIEEENTRNVAELSGIPSINPSIGGNFNDAGSPLFNAFQEVMNALNKKPHLGSIGYLNLIDLQKIKFKLDNLEITLGSLTEIDYKLQMLEKAKEELAANPKGRIDLSVIGKAYFIGE